ncbi:hypothetical protein SAMN02745830_06029 [Streptomyces sp. Amel2xC10]|nr:hypothetical protein SAMN02745830_06029 [Streptomyces sp. Amel2xC10]
MTFRLFSPERPGAEAIPPVAAAVRRLGCGLCYLVPGHLGEPARTGLDCEDRARGGMR